MEKLGGGGHLSNAATQLKDVTIAEAEKQLISAIDAYWKEKHNYESYFLERRKR